jgi:hypothetical protein
LREGTRAMHNTHDNLQDWINQWWPVAAPHDLHRARQEERARIVQMLEEFTPQVPYIPLNCDEHLLHDLRLLIVFALHAQKRTLLYRLTA